MAEADFIMEEQTEDTEADAIREQQQQSDEPIRRSARQKKPTEKMIAYQVDLREQELKKLNRNFEIWKSTVRDIRKTLKENCSEKELSEMGDFLKCKEGNVIMKFEEIRESIPSPSEYVRKIDACTAVTSDILRVINERISGVEEYERELVVKRLSALKENSYARSVFSCITERSHESKISEKVAEAAAELAVKQTEYQHLSEESAQKAKIAELEATHKATMQEHYDKLKNLEVKRNLNVAQARVDAYSRIMNYHEPSLRISDINRVHLDDRQPRCDQSIVNSETNDSIDSAKVSEPCTQKQRDENNNEMKILAQTLTESIYLNRLPIPEPNVFSGDPLQYVEWRSTFKTLIERNGVPSEEKIFYLKKYTGGPARKALEGYFYGSNVTAFENAIKLLDERYGHPFIIQKAFRHKLERWPKISSRDSIGLRDFADFLRSCRDAMPYIPNLSILDDSTENQKLVYKLPEWVLLRWNREVTQTLETKGEYPNFSRFVDFVTEEAKVACNPVSSLYAISLDNDTDQKKSKDTKGKSASNSNRALATSTQNHEESTSKGKTVNMHCEYCNKDNHYLFRCEVFLTMTIDKRREFVRNKKLCFGCLRKGHVNKECKKRHTCAVCKKKHPTCLHEDRWDTTQQVTNNSNTPQIINNSVLTPNSYLSTSMIVPVWVSSQENPSREILTYAMLDTQSDTTFILNDAATALELHSQNVKLSLSTMTSQNTHIESSKVTGLKVRAFNTTDHVIINNAYTRDFIPVDRSHIPQSETLKGWSHLTPLIDKIPPLQSCEVGLLIGYNCPQALAPRNVIIGLDNEPYAVETLLGWSIVGYTSDKENMSSTYCHRTMVRTKELPTCSPKDLIKVLERDFADDNCKDNKVSQNDLHFLNILEKSICVGNDKHIELPLPFKQRPLLPNNKHQAEIRLNHLKRKMKDTKYEGHYKQFMKGLIERGEAERVDQKGKDGNIWYIPHHGIYHAQKPNKIRVVFDCSARYCNTSLNDHLLTGPDLTNGLVGVLCRFRERPVAVMCDIEGMFHQFKVCVEDRDFLRFLWWEEGDVNKPVLEYRMSVHLFGAASSPGCANYGLKYLARNQKSIFPKASQFILNDFYVDDGLTSLETEEEAVQMVKDAVELCAEGSLHLHKFVSNSKAVLESIPMTERADDVKNLDLSLEKLPIQRALGVKWSLEDDVFIFDVNIKDHKATRRKMLSIVASIFDPLGFLSPLTLKGKRLLQEICKKGIDWDEPLPENIQFEWKKWVEDLQNLQNSKIPRPLKPLDWEKPVRIELHHFSDASNDGYGQSSYLRFIGENTVFCTFVIGKARVAPNKVVSIPRLELTAALLSIKMSKFLKQELSLHIDDEYFWTDSRVVLGYINNDARRFHVFVANRVQMIRDSSLPSQWLYVCSENNPADHASRGLCAVDLNHSTWLRGPPFLWERDICIESVSKELQLGDPEVKSARSLCMESKVLPGILERFDRFSCWFKLVAVMARLLRLSNGLKGTHFPSVKERLEAEKALIKLVQNCAFSDTISSLKNCGRLPRTDPLYPLDPILHDGLLCVGGRLRKSDLSNRCKHPVILPRNSHISMLILTHVHEEVQHQGRGITLNKLRSSGYWIVGGSKVVANYIRNCVTCRRLRRPTECQRMADLPSERVSPSPPFLYCGMDCFGPFIVKQGRKEMKRYGLLFTCMCTRAIHIEMLDDMSTDAFINGLRCFIAIRGAVKQMRSDQGSNFVGAKNEFERELSRNKISKYLAERHCEFVMNAPHSSHTGGVWERQIKTVRSILNAVLLLCPGRLDDSSLRTVFYEVMSIVNSRPLSVSEIDNPNVIEPLTPNHILTAKCHVPDPPPGNFVKEDLLLRKRWRRVQYLLEQFWTRWRKEYVSQIALRQKWHEKRRNIHIGDIVLVKDIDLPRNQWPLARVVDITVDDDGLVRKAKVQLGQRGSSVPTIFERSVHKLVTILEHN